MERLHVNFDFLNFDELEVPQYIYESFLKHSNRKVVITQPRRIAATSLSKRVAEERNEKLGGKVGYSIRFEDRTSSDTQIHFMTDGMLLRSLLSDPEMRLVDFVILILQLP